MTRMPRHIARAISDPRMIAADTTLMQPKPATDELFTPWPGDENAPPRDAARMQRFREQRQDYLRYLHECIAAMDVMDEVWREHGRGRRDAACRAARRHRAAVLARDGHICGICGDPLDEADVTIDHIVPVSRGGSDDPENLQPAHRSCNSRKHARLPGEYSLSPEQA